MKAELTFFKQRKIQALKLILSSIRFWSFFEAKKLIQRLTKSSLSTVEFHWALGAMHFFTLQNIQANVTGTSRGLNDDPDESIANFSQTKQFNV